MDRSSDLERIIARENIKFLDFGCSTGGSLKRFSGMYGGNCRGLGLDIDPRKVAAARKAGFAAAEFDIRELASSRIKVNFVSMSHFLEHIADAQDITRIIKVACHIARHFVVIVQPNFDTDGLLMRIGLKPYWSDWSGHPNRMSSLELHNILNPMYEKGSIDGFRIYARDRIRNASDPRIVPLSTPRNSHKRVKKGDAALGRAKEFAFPVHAETVAIIEKRNAPFDWLENKLSNMELLFATPSAAERA